MSMTTADPFQHIIDRAKAREQAEAQLLEEKRAQQAIEREQRKVEQEQEQEQKRLEQIRINDRLEAERVQQKLVRDVRYFVGGFFDAVAKTALSREWTSEEAIMARDYSHALICHLDRELPEVSSKIAHSVQQKFAYGISLNKVDIPKTYFVGQRADWFDEKLAEANKQPRPNSTISNKSA